MKQNTIWLIKLLICVIFDLVDFLFGRFLFPAPLVGEVLGTIVVTALFGWQGLFYLWEALDPSEQVDAFVPTATLIALANRPRDGRAHSKPEI